ncbi:MAG TPA: HlyD family secretion protein, partial [Dysgonamonadaceae bacterium]|nr:HlyD family secretion protein [Dysgonamonadaceae bacterium]
MEENKQIELRSEKVRNIIGQIPPILITHGTMFIGLALLSLFLAAAFIPYQPTIDTDITVLQMPNDKLYFTAKIPQKEMNKQLQF